MNFLFLLLSVSVSLQVPFSIDVQWRISFFSSLFSLSLSLLYSFVFEFFFVVSKGIDDLFRQTTEMITLAVLATIAYIVNFVEFFSSLSVYVLFPALWFSFCFARLNATLPLMKYSTRLFFPLALFSCTCFFLGFSLTWDWFSLNRTNSIWLPSTLFAVNFAALCICLVFPSLLSYYSFGDAGAVSSSDKEMKRLLTFLLTSFAFLFLL